MTSKQGIDVKRSPSLPFMTSTMLTAAANQLGSDVARTMANAQVLFEGGDVGQSCLLLKHKSVCISAIITGALRRRCWWRRCWSALLLVNFCMSAGDALHCLPLLAHLLLFFAPDGPLNKICDTVDAFCKDKSSKAAARQTSWSCGHTTYFRCPVKS